MGRSVEDSSCRCIDWTQLNKIQNEQFRIRLGSFAQQALAFFYDIVLEFVRVQSEVDKYKTQIKQKKISSLSCTECDELKKRIAVQDDMLASLGSSIMKVTETRHLESHISEAMKILSSDHIIPTPPPEQEPIAVKVEKGLSQQGNDDEQDKNHLKTQKKIDEHNENSVTTIPRKVKAEKESISDCSDVSVMDGSIYEIHGTPTGRTSPILRTKASRSRQQPLHDLRSHSKRASAASKIMMLSTRGAGGGGAGGGEGRGRSRQTRLVAVPRTRRVDVTGSELYSGGARRPTANLKLEFMRTSTEDDDIILPSPTSESIKNFSIIGQASRGSPLPTELPALTSQDETRVFVCDVDFDEPFAETHVDASPNLLQGYERGATECAPPSPVLCENRNACNVRPPRVHRDTDASVSVLRPPPRRARSERENAAPAARQVTMSDMEAKSPSPKNAKVVGGEEDATVCEATADSSVPLMRQYGAAAANIEKSRIEKRAEAAPEFAYKEEVVRKRAEKRQLPAWGCADCEKYYELAYGGDDERARRAKGACSRHRGRFDPAPAATPPGFWDLHLSVPDDTHHFNLLNGVE